MKNTGQKLILTSFILALIASAFIFMYLQSLKGPKHAGGKTTILVAAETIPARTLISKKMLKEMQVSDAAPFTDYLKSTSEIVGKYTKETIMKNEGFYKENLFESNSNELSMKLDNNHRAISINMTGASGVADLLKPGDFVDVMVYLAEKRDGTQIVRPDIAKMILQNIEVLAVDKQLSRDASSTSVSDNQKNMSGFLVTLSVQTSDIERLVLAENMGSLKLALRPVKDSDTIVTSGTTGQELVENSNSNDGTVLNQDNNSTKTNNANNNVQNYTSYTVKDGDTLKKISNAFYGDTSKYTVIKEANNIQDEDLILTGEVIKIPVLKQ